MSFASINMYSVNTNICTKMICHRIKIISEFIIHVHVSNIKVWYQNQMFWITIHLTSYHFKKHIKLLHVNTVYIPPEITVNNELFCDGVKNRYLKSLVTFETSRDQEHRQETLIKVERNKKYRKNTRVMLLTWLVNWCWIILSFIW